MAMLVRVLSLAVIALGLVAVTADRPGRGL